MKKLIFAVCTVAAGSALLAADVESDNVYGIVNVASDTKTTVISVPWTRANGSGNIPVSELVSTASLATGDKLYYYEGSKWYSYTLSNSAWEPSTTVTDGEYAAATKAAEKYLSRGTALVLVRGNTVDHPILLGGKYDSTPPSPTTVAPGAIAFIGNPATETKYITAGNVGDTVQVFGDDGTGASIVYQKFASGWYLTGAGRPTKVADGVPVDAGHGVMYHASSSGSESVTVW